MCLYCFSCSAFFIHQQVCNLALVFPIFSWRDFAQAAADPCSPDLIDLKIFPCEKGFGISKLTCPFWIVVSLPFSAISLSAQHCTVLAFVLILCWKLPPWASVQLLLIRRGHSVFFHSCWSCLFADPIPSYFSCTENIKIHSMLSVQVLCLLHVSPLKQCFPCHYSCGQQPWPPVTLRWTSAC